MTTKKLDKPPSLHLNPKQGKSRRKIDHRALATCVRDSCSVQLLADYPRAVLAGHGEAKVVWDVKHPNGGYVTWPAKNEMTSTPQQIAWAWDALVKLGHGIPASAKDTEERVAKDRAGAGVSADVVANLSLAQMAQIVAIAAPGKAPRLAAGPDQPAEIAPPPAELAELPPELELESDSDEFI